VSEDAFGPAGDNRPKVFRQGPEGVHVLATITWFHLVQSRQNLCDLSEGVFGPTENMQIGVGLLMESLGIRQGKKIIMLNIRMP
jgi:hypothetical protein